MNDTPKNIPASVRQRLVNLAKIRRIEFQRILVLYTMERLLYRLSVSPFADRFILKGASLFTLWLNEPHRRTRDVDLLGKDDPNTAHFTSLFIDLCKLIVDEDGLRFDPETVKARPIREENDFGGVRITLTAYLENARIALQVDIGFGDTAIPEPLMVDFPTLLKEFAAPHLLAYQKETTIAEKLHAMVVLERSNSRMKDFFDIYVLSQEFSFSMDRLSLAVHDAFARRGTEIPTQIPDGLTQEFAQDPAKQSQWKAFLKQYVSPPRDTLPLASVINVLAVFLIPVIAAARNNAKDTVTWSPGSSWKADDQA